MSKLESRKDQTETRPTTGEWTVELIWQNFSQSGILKIKKLSDAHNAALAAERDEWIVANRDLAILVLKLREQLAAEREKLVSYKIKVRNEIEEECRKTIQNLQSQIAAAGERGVHLYESPSTRND